MSSVENPALKAFVAQMGAELTLAQVLIQRRGAGYELRHVEDREASADSLRQLLLPEVRSLAQYNAAGEFRPLKSAPDLRRGWRLSLANDAELEAALNQLYPGTLADWFAAQAANPPATNYREYMSRQSGMYRITTMLTDVQVAEVINAVCAKNRCLKRRLWTVAGMAADEPGIKSLIPCLEPCAVLMESARQVLRASQQENSGQP
jgi:4Fe-4S iron-sulfur cluster binding domain/DR2241 stabilising domain